MEKNTILLSHRLQRPEGQWNRKQKTDLIDSLLRKYPINPTYSIKENGILSVIDGVQRLSCVRDFLLDNFALSKDMESVIINGEEKILAGLKFSKLDEDTKDAILNSELQIYELTDCTEKDIVSEKIKLLANAMDKFDETFSENIKIPVTSIPMVLYSGYRILKDNKSFKKLIELVNEFLENYDSNEEYKKYVQSGTSSVENVRGRFDYWKNLIKTA